AARLCGSARLAAICAGVLLALLRRVSITRTHSFANRSLEMKRVTSALLALAATLSVSIVGHAYPTKYSPGTGKTRMSAIKNLEKADFAPGTKFQTTITTKAKSYSLFHATEIVSPPNRPYQFDGNVMKVGKRLFQAEFNFEK